MYTYLAANFFSCALTLLCLNFFSRSLTLLHPNFFFVHICCVKKKKIRAQQGRIRSTKYLALPLFYFHLPCCALYFYVLTLLCAYPALRFNHLPCCSFSLFFCALTPYTLAFYDYHLPCCAIFLSLTMLCLFFRVPCCAIILPCVYPALLKLISQLSTRLRANAPIVPLCWLVQTKKCRLQFQPIGS